jgi:orotate phosphoribosyltransferase
MSLDRPELAKRIYDTSHLTGNFVLRSGITSHEYFDKYLFEADPALLKEICLHLQQHLPKNPQGLAGLELGGVPLAAVLSQITGLPLYQVRKKAKEYGTCRQVEGGEVHGQKLVIVEDVVTSGGQIIELAGVLRRLGTELLGVVCVVDREAGATKNLAEADLPFHPLFSMTELKAAAGVPPE